MRIRLILLISVVALAGVALFAAVSSGGTGSVPVTSTLTKPMDKAPKDEVGTRVKRSDVPKAAAKRARRRVTLTYFVGPVHAIAPGAIGPLFNFTCPSGQHVITGFYKTDRAVVADFFNQSRATVRAWQFGYVNLANVTGHYQNGIICAKNVAG